MEKLAKREEQIMQAFWKLNKAFVKEVVQELPDPKPHYNSVATMVRILEEKGFLNHKAYGKTFQYYPVVSEETYKNSLVNSVVDKYFDKSYSKMIAHFAENEKISEKDLKRILQLIKSKK
ncbi:BlaI/MecI/CopY family transcriptional regulator [uncultured Croceitalea sp.]|uniref:BlaI/MecI/CopY family transcriptional regulator n=1 Tax=uncultured Croceitalea sp. TaxID=1798908 RepID=UPI0033058C64